MSKYSRTDPRSLCRRDDIGPERVEWLGRAWTLYTDGVCALLREDALDVPGADPRHVATVRDLYDERSGGPMPLTWRKVNAERFRAWAFADALPMCPWCAAQGREKHDRDCGGPHMGQIRSALTWIAFDRLRLRRVLRCVDLSADKTLKVWTGGARDALVVDGLGFRAMLMPMTQPPPPGPTLYLTAEDYIDV